MKTVPQLLRDAADIYEQRNAIYGDNYKKLGAWLGPLMRGSGVVPVTDDDWGRLAYRILMLHKISRDLQNFHKGGHGDSLDDLSVYSMMVRELDALAGEIVVAGGDGEADVVTTAGKTTLKFKFCKCGHLRGAHRFYSAVEGEPPDNHECIDKACTCTKYEEAGEGVME